MPAIDAISAFVAVARELHFTRAAARLRIAQPALTKRIQQLERDVGVRLFVRSRRAVRLSAEGEILLLKAEQILGAVDEFRSASERLRLGSEARLRIGFTPSAPYHVLPAVMRAFRRKHPNVECILNEASSEAQTRKLLDGELDVGILRPPLVRPRTLSFEIFLREPFVAALPADHALESRRSLTLAELASEPLVLVARRVVAAVYDQIIGACRSAGFEPHIAQEGSDVHAVMGLVAAGCGLSVLPASVAALAHRYVVYRPIRDGSLRTIMAAATVRRHGSAAARDFVETLKHPSK